MTERVVMAMRLVEGFIGLMMGRRVQVNWNNRASVTPDGVINLPQPKTGDAAEIALLTRLGTHECGHLKHTDAGSSDRLSREEHAVFNALEDPRMERAQTQTYPGATVILSRGLDEMLPTIAEGLDERLQADPGQALSLDVLFRGYLALAPHGPMQRHAPGLLQKLAAVISQEEREAIDEAMGLLAAAQGSRDAEKIAQGLLARLAPPPAPEPPVPPDEAAAEPEGAKEPESEGSTPPKSADGEPESSETETPADSASTDDGESQSDGTEPQQLAPAHSQEQEGGKSPATNDADAPEQGQGGGQSEPSGSDNPDSDGQADDAADSAGSDAGGASPNGEPAEEQPTGNEGQAGSPGDQSQDASSGESNGGQSAQAGDGSAASGEPEAGDAAQEPGSTGNEAPGSTDVQAETSPAEEGGKQGAAAQAKAPSEPVDLGTLIREAIVNRYGPSKDAEDDPADEPLAAMTEADLDRIRAVLAAATPDGQLEQLLEASLVALAQSPGDNGESGEGGPSGGAGMYLAGPTGTSNAMQSRLQGVQSRLVTVLQRELQDRKRKPTRAAHAGGRIMTNRFWRLSTLGDTKVFAKSRLASGMDAAATVLVDSSWSMNSSLAEALQVAMGFSLAMQRLAIKTRVVRFPATETVTETLQSFGESPRACVDRCARISASGGTPVGTATALELPILLAQKRQKNFLVIVTDDDPGDPEVFLAAIREAHQKDVLVVGVGIGCDIRGVIPASVSVQSVDELPDALTRLFRENISTKLAA
jgi:hypothetical protein